MVLYAAKFKYNKPILVRMHINKETPKKYYLSEYNLILGWDYFGDGVFKREYQWFKEAREALEWLSQEMIDEARKLKGAASKLEEGANDLLEIAKAGEANKLVNRAIAKKGPHILSGKFEL